MLAEIFDGLRSFYSRKEGAASAPSFSAAMLLSFLLCVNIASVATIFDVLVHDRVTIAGWFVRHKMVAVAAGIAIASAHIAFAKRAGLYYRTGPALSTTWKRIFTAYCLVTGFLFATSLLIAYLTRASGENV